MKKYLYIFILVLSINLFSQTADKNILKTIIITELNNHQKFGNKIHLLNEFDENYTHLITLDDIMISFSKELHSDGKEIYSDTKYDYDKFRKDFVEKMQDVCFRHLLNEKNIAQLYIQISTKVDLFYDIKLYY
ncbi:hypothetical protein [Moheibacter lacus]|uniref:Uncharacterized protein n=1 Tax=Moheibacter lacus TaxID=2745851 RepID=A0A838ZHH4_9FLAO|nr:hypothetical protein [Moheibacter lacus]MBA5628708.1 hypothetical protein [Moheibacter lacus]